MFIFTPTQRRWACIVEISRGIQNKKYSSARTLFEQPTPNRTRAWKTVVVCILYSKISVFGHFLRVNNETFWNRFLIRFFFFVYWWIFMMRDKSKIRPQFRADTKKAGRYLLYYMSSTIMKNKNNIRYIQ